MKSDVFYVEANNLSNILDETERFGSYCNLKNEDTLLLRLLAEEMLGLIQHILNISESSFWIESNNNKFELYIKSKAAVTLKQKDELISVSTSGKNYLAKGILGKIRSVMEESLMCNKEFNYIGMSLTMNNTYALGGECYPYIWSMADFHDKANAQEKAEAWDGLEKSILVNKADDIVMGVKASEVLMIVKKEFK